MKVFGYSLMEIKLSLFISSSKLSGSTVRDSTNLLNSASEIREIVLLGKVTEWLSGSW